MWVTVDEVTWMDQHASLHAGGRLPGVGLRLQGEPVSAEGAARRDGMVAVGVPPAHHTVTGVVSHVRDIRGDGDPHAELVLTVGRDRFQVQFGGRASLVTDGARVTVRGQLGIVGGYEWEAFDLPDTRADWRVRAVMLREHVGGFVDLARVD